MKIYKKIMGIVVKIENAVLALSILLVLVLTFGNVIARKISSTLLVSQRKSRLLFLY